MFPKFAIIAGLNLLGVELGVLNECSETRVLL